MVDPGASGGRQPVHTEAWSSVATVDPPHPPAPPGTSTQSPAGGPGRGAPWWVVVVVALLAALLAGGGVFAWSRLAASRGPGTQQETTSTALADLAAKYEATRAELDALKKTTATKPADATAKPTDTSSTSKQYTLIKKVYIKSGTWYVSADYVQFLTGAEAAAQATAHGDESPPPNGYYILNDTALLRELPVAATANVRIMGGTGGDPSSPRNQTLSSFHDWFVSSSTDKNWVKDGVYVLTLAGGTVTAIDQQFIP